MSMCTITSKRQQNYPTPTSIDKNSNLSVYIGLLHKKIFEDLGIKMKIEMKI